MSLKKPFLTLAAGLCLAVLAGCASQPASTPTAPAPAAPAAPAPAPTASAPPVTQQEQAQAEAVTADALDKKFRDAARSYKIVEKDGKTMYCKREKVIGSTIPTMQCISESQLRLQVEQMDVLRERMRSGSKCTLSRGCSGS